MPRFSINASMMLTEYAFLDRFHAAADLGFAGVDIQFPYEHPADLVAARAASAGVDVVLINVPAGNLMTGGDGLACVPGRERAFEEGLILARHYARALGCKRVNVLSGRVPEGVSEAQATPTLVGNLQRAADIFAEDGVTVMVEPCNTRDVPRYLVRRTAQAIAILDEAGRDNLAVQFDFYHRQIMEGDLIEGFRAALPRIAHVQFADTPGRHEPGTGEIAFERVFAAIDASGYDGWAGAEYRPSSGTKDSLGWMR
ncbi:TIM barrel protein [Mesorhizobium sp. CAU 1741]|uniref:hydroxypyruvate isomerase family protein n=1 Tax=Mesorhizobium sp. CAU 1741 TaxID=3140366 RepID=UPI00325B938B